MKKKWDAALLDEQELASQSKDIIKRHAEIMSIWETHCIASSYVVSEWAHVNRDFLVHAVQRLNEVSKEESFEGQKQKIAEIAPEIANDLWKRMLKFSYTASAISGAVFNKHNQLVKSAAAQAQADMEEAMGAAWEQQGSSASARPEEPGLPPGYTGSPRGPTKSTRKRKS